MKALFLALAAIPLIASPVSAAPNERVARVVLFIPKDAEPPENYQQRLGSLATRAESFFSKWMKHWNYPAERSQIFARDEKGAVEVTVVRENLSNTSGREALPEIRQKAVRGASIQLGLKPRAEVVWWVLYDYPGVKGFQGGARNFGGLAVNAYPPGTEAIDQKAELASPAFNDVAIKGTIHEFGHALGLPHIGPRPDLKLGNTLMGPINRSFWGRNAGNDPRVYLSEASAAALWKHPIFRKESTPTPPMPAKLTVDDLDVADTPDGKGITVRGKLTADLKAHTAIVLDSERGRYGDYWERSYVGKIDPETGTFEVIVSQPSQRGTLFLSFCFDNGVNTADGKKAFQQGTPIEVPYQATDGKRQFDKRDR